MPAAPSRNPNRWQQIEDLFNEALHRDEKTRAAFLEEACGTDAELRREVESLLASLQESAPFIEHAVRDVAASYLGRETPPVIEPGWMFDQYCVVRLLGAGGMGEVYLAEDTRLKRKVALKMLPRQLTRNGAALRRFQQEAQMLSGLNHANLLTVFDFCEVGGRHFLVTEFVEGETLRQRLDRGPIDYNEAADIAMQIASALTIPHAAGIIHRDIKPENIMLRADGCVKVLDFGIAKLTEPSEDGQRGTPAPGLTVAGTLLGTPRYMSPEQARGVPVDERTDIFSLGTVLYECLTGRPAFLGDTQSDLVADILRSDPPPVARSLPRRAAPLALIVERALSKDRTKRYERADEMRDDLQRFRRDQDFRQRSPGGREWWGIAISAAVILIVAGFLLLRTRKAAVSETTPRSLAVLPFRNLKPSPETDFLGFSLADQVIAKLGYVKALVVRPSSAINRYRDGAADLRRVAADLNAGMLLTGTYLREGDMVHITARLTGFKPGRVLWQNTINVKYGNLLTVQDMVPEMIIAGLELHLAPDEEARLKSEPRVNSLAYEYYLRGVDLYSISKFSSAITMLEKSASIDADYAPTWAHLGRAYTTNASLQFGGREDYRRAEAAYDKAIALNPVFAEPRVYMANLLTDTGRVEQAVPLLRVALRSTPTNAEAHWELGYAYRFGGMLKESAAECELARRLDPEVKINSSALNTYLYLGEYDKFLQSLPSNDSPLLVFYHGFGLYYKHAYGEADSDFQRAYELAPDLLQAQIGQSLSDGLEHHSAAGIARLHETERKMTDCGVTDAEAMYKIAQAYTLLGDAPDALRMLKRSTEGGFFCYSYIAQDPLLMPLRGLSEFGRTLEQVRQRQEQFQNRFGSKPLRK